MHCLNVCINFAPVHQKFENSRIVSQKKFICSSLVISSTDRFTVIGEEDWVIEQAVDHLIYEHSNEDTPQLRAEVKASLIDPLGD